MNFRSHSRWAPLCTAAWFAAGFIVLRVVYRVVFLGANGSGLVLWSGRPIHLDGPFRMISLFGPVTTGGIWSSVMDALPFALCILACGFLFALVDVRRLLALAARARFGRSILTALAIGVSTYPALVRTWRSMRQIHRLRRERGGFSVLGPLFERTLERAAVLGESMELRGFGKRATHEELDCSVPGGVTELTLRRGDRVLAQDVSFALHLGDFVLLTGQTGSGKTSLLRALAGLQPDLARGTVCIGGADRANLSLTASSSFVGYLPQSVRTAFVAATVRDELAFGLISQGFSNGEVDVRMREVVDALRLDHMLERSIESLSAGEAVLVGLGAVLMGRPTLLLLDEPFADLDSEQASHVAGLLARLATTTQMCVVIAEHRTGLLSPLATRRFHLANARVVESLGQNDAQAESVSGSVTETSRLMPDESLFVEATHGSSRAITALIGPNGSGKTTALSSRALAAPGDVALVPEDLADFFIRDTVQAECLRSDHTAGRPAGSTHALFISLLSGREVDSASHPRDLSAGQQLALAIAIQCVAAPRELLIDEPTRGLDAAIRVELAQVLRACSAQTAVTVATHDADFVDLLQAQKVSVIA